MDEASATESATDGRRSARRLPRALANARRRVDRLRLGLGLPWLFALGIVVLVVIGLASALLVARTRDSAEAANHSLEVENAISTMQLLLRRSESGQRGYLLTGDERYRSIFDRSVDEVLPATDRIRILLADNDNQQRLLDQIADLLKQKVDEMKQTVAHYDAGRVADAMALVRSDRGQALNEALGPPLATMKTTEQQLTRSRTETLRGTSLQLLVINLAGLATIVLLAVAATIETRRTQQALRAASEQLAGVNEALEAKVAERTADLVEANDEIQRFAYIVSHDLRAPLVNIMGFTSELEALRGDIAERLDAARGNDDPQEAARDEQLARDVDEALGFIKASIGRMDRLINAILKISREGRRDFHPEPIDMSALVGAIVASLEHQLQETGTKVRIDRLPPLTSDRLAVEQIFTNLMDNAIKYLRPGVPGEIAVTCVGSAAGNVYSVSDNGRGIAERDLERVFELFRRAGTQDRPGEGIGLAHVRTLVRRLGGSISIESVPDHGSVFRVTLPKRWTDVSAREQRL